MRRVFVVGALSAFVVALVPSAGAQTTTVTSVIGSADGLFAELDAEFIILEDGASAEEDVGALQPLFTFGPEPSVTLPPEGGSVSDQVANVNETVGDDVLTLSASLLTAAAQGSLGPAGDASAETTVADLALDEAITPEEVGAQQLVDPIIEAELISATCEADLTGVSGATTLVSASILGNDLDEEPAPNTQFTIAIENGISASINVTLNRQVQNSDGSLSVTALVIEITIDVPEVLSVSGTLQVGPATCGVVEGEVPPPPAPAPAPVTAQVRFTG